MKNIPKLLGRAPLKTKVGLPPLIASEAPSAGVGRSDRIKVDSKRLVKVRKIIARYELIEKTLVNDLIDLTEVGQLVLSNRHGLPFMKLNHLHYPKKRVEAYTRGPYDSISLTPL